MPRHTAASRPSAIAIKSLRVGEADSGVGGVIVSG